MQTCSRTTRRQPPGARVRARATRCCAASARHRHRLRLELLRRLPGVLAGLGLAELLGVAMLPAEARVAKPDARIFALALARLGVDAAFAAYVGDDAARDLAGARAAGLAAVDATGLATLASPRAMAGAGERRDRNEQTEVHPYTLRFFRERFGLEDRGLASGLYAALARRVDYVDIFVEVTTGFCRARGRDCEEGRSPPRAGGLRARARG